MSDERPNKSWTHAITGLPTPVIQTSPAHQLRVSAFRASAGQTLLEVRDYTATAKQREAGNWRPLPNVIRVPLAQVEELSAALAEVAEVLRNQQRNRHAR
jgi:hypothetical protein